MLPGITPQAGLFAGLLPLEFTVASVSTSTGTGYITFPNDIEAGDLLVGIGSASAGGYFYVESGTKIGSGFTLIAKDYTDSGAGPYDSWNCNFAYKIATGSESGNSTGWSNYITHGMIVCYRPNREFTLNAVRSGSAGVDVSGRRISGSHSGTLTGEYAFPVVFGQTAFGTTTLAFTGPSASIQNPNTATSKAYAALIKGAGSTVTYSSNQDGGTCWFDLS